MIKPAAYERVLKQKVMFAEREGLPPLPLAVIPREGRQNSNRGAHFVLHFFLPFRSLEQARLASVHKKCSWQSQEHHYYCSAEREGFELSPEYYDCQIIEILSPNNYTKYAYSPDFTYPFQSTLNVVKINLC